MAAAARCVQVDSATEGVRALTQSTGKRVDEHAAAIQRLTLVGAMMHAPVALRLHKLQERSCRQAAIELARSHNPGPRLGQGCVHDHPRRTHVRMQAINSHMEERPTSSVVRHMVEAATLESGEKLGSALLPVWDAVKALQVSVCTRVRPHTPRVLMVVVDEHTHCCR